MLTAESLHKLNAVILVAAARVLSAHRPGLVNGSNWCYMNSMLQVLANSEKFIAANKKFEDGQIMHAMNSTMLWLTTTTSTFDATFLKAVMPSIMGESVISTTETRQADPLEFLANYLALADTNISQLFRIRARIFYERLPNGPRCRNQCPWQQSEAFISEPACIAAMDLEKSTGEAEFIKCPICDFPAEIPVLRHYDIISSSDYVIVGREDTHTKVPGEELVILEKRYRLHSVIVYLSQIHYVAYCRSAIGYTLYNDSRVSSVDKLPAETSGILLRFFFYALY